MSNSDRKLEYIKIVPYSNKVLVGSWFEERSKYQKTNHIPLTTTLDDYSAKPYSRNDPNIVWNAKLKFESSILSRQNPDSKDNFTTLYDLSYNHFPKTYKTQIPRIFKSRLEYYEPRDEYMEYFGNLTNYGLLDNKKILWKIDSRIQSIPTSLYQNDYIKPDGDSYNFKRWPKNMGTNTCRNIRRIPGKHPLCNPITWESVDNPKTV